MTAPADAMLDGLPDRFPPHLRSLPRLLAAQAARWPDRPLFSAGDASWTVAQCAAVAAATASALAGAGIGRGDRVAILCGNRPAFMQAFLGTACRGAVLVPVNTAAKGPQVRYALENSSARLLIAEDELLDPRFEVVRAGRGGRYTYHGPGQRIAYVLIDLGKRRLAVLILAGVHRAILSNRRLRFLSL